MADGAHLIRKAEEWSVFQKALLAGGAQIEKRFRDDSCRRQEAQLVLRGIGQLLMEGLGMSSVDPRP